MKYPEISTAQRQKADLWLSGSAGKKKCEVEMFFCLFVLVEVKSILELGSGD